MLLSSSISSQWLRPPLSSRISATEQPWRHAALVFCRVDNGFRCIDHRSNAVASLVRLLSKEPIQKSHKKDGPRMNCLRERREMRKRLAGCKETWSKMLNIPPSLQISYHKLPDLMSYSHFPPFIDLSLNMVSIPL